jgi:hypothetical protein
VSKEQYAARTREQLTGKMSLVLGLALCSMHFAQLALCSLRSARPPKPENFKIDVALIVQLRFSDVGQ